MTKLYKIDSKGKTRVWWIESDHEKYRTHSGILNGKIVTSGWTYPEQKNVGKTNETSIQEQVNLEVESEYTKKKNQGRYHDSLDNIQEHTYHAPMLATKYNEKKHGNMRFISQPKLDGVRLIASKDGLFSRQGKEFVSIPHIWVALQPIFEEYPEVIFDGEIYNHEFHDDFNRIISMVRKTKPTDADLEESRKYCQYWIYDSIYQYPYSIRLDSINGLLDENPHDSLVKIPYSYVQGKDEFDEKLMEYLGDGYEGQMLRVPDSQYENKRSNNLIKHKVMDDDEFEVVDILEGIGTWSGYCKSVVIKLNDGSIQQAGIRGTQEYLKGVLENGDEYIGGQATVLYQNKTPDGKLRFPIVKTLWKDKRNV